MTDAAADYRGGGPGHPPAAAGGRLSVEGGGVAFWSPARGWQEPQIAGAALRRVVAGPGEPADGRSPVGYRVLDFEGLVEARLVRYAFRLSAWDAPRLLSDLARERQRAGLPAIHVPKELDPAGEDRTTWGGCARPSARERDSLPEGSLPHSWLAATAGPGMRKRTRHVDGMSMLLELAVRGLVDADRSRLVVGQGETGAAALDGALERLGESGCPTKAEEAAGWLGAYAGGLTSAGVDADGLRALIGDAIASDVPLDLRTALIVWLVKQDEGLGQGALAAITGGRARDARRALRRASPDLYATADREAAARAHRVLRASIVGPWVPFI